MLFAILSLFLPGEHSHLSVVQVGNMLQVFLSETGAGFNRAPVAPICLVWAMVCIGNVFQLLLGM